MANAGLQLEDVNGYMNNPPVGQPQPKRGQRSGRRAVHNLKVDAMPIEEALKTMTIQELTSPNNMKTPISVLQELLSRRGITPQYDLIQVEGAVHEPTFRYRVSYHDKDAMGTGKSKKDAKHAAAKALIDKLTGLQISDLPMLNNAIPLSSDLSGDGDDQSAGNPIGWLQEMCMSRRWPPPTYETEMEVGLPHERQFTIACVVLKYREIGKGKSKKIAKRCAAHKMWQLLQENPLDHNQIVACLDEEGNEEMKIESVKGHYTGLKEARIQSLTKDHGQKVSTFHKNLKARVKLPALGKLQKTCLNSPQLNYVEMLQEISSEQRFEVTYVDIDEKTISGRFQCLVQLSTLPVAVCHGSGASPQEAQISAARNSLEYLKIMTKT